MDGTGRPAPGPRTHRGACPATTPSGHRAAVPPLCLMRRLPRVTRTHADPRPCSQRRAGLLTREESKAPWAWAALHASLTVKTSRCVWGRSGPLTECFPDGQTPWPCARPPTQARSGSSGSGTEQAASRVRCRAPPQPTALAAQPARLLPRGSLGRTPPPSPHTR